MINIQNTDAINAIRNSAKLSISEGCPQQLIRSVQPVMDMTPVFHKKTDFVKSNSRTTNGTTTVYTVPTDRKTFVTGVLLSYCGDAAFTPTQIEVYTTINSVATSLARIAAATLAAASNDTVYVQFAHPIELSKGASIAHAFAFGAGVGNSICSIYGYEEGDIAY